MSKTKGYHESFARFFESPTRESLRNLIKDNVGELRVCDFKAQWPEHSSLAKHVLGMANSGGGCLVIGVEEQADKSLEPVGMPAITDKADITNGLKNYLPTDLLKMVDVLDFSFDASEYPKLIGKRFQVVFVEYRPGHIPFVSTRAGSSIRSATVYVRREGSTEEANHDELQRLLNARIETGHSTTKEVDLKEHLDQLKVLFAEIPKIRQGPSPFATMSSLFSSGSFFGPSQSNPNYPKEGFEAFVLRMIELKKLQVSEELGVSPRP